MSQLILQGVILLFKGKERGGVRPQDYIKTILAKWTPNSPSSLQEITKIFDNKEWVNNKRNMVEDFEPTDNEKFMYSIITWIDPIQPNTTKYINTHPNIYITVATITICATISTPLSAGKFSLLDYYNWNVPHARCRTNRSTNQNCYQNKNTTRDRY